MEKVYNADKVAVAEKQLKDFWENKKSPLDPSLKELHLEAIKNIDKYAVIRDNTKIAIRKRAEEIGLNLDRIMVDGSIALIVERHLKTL